MRLFALLFLGVAAWIFSDYHSRMEEARGIGGDWKFYKLSREIELNPSAESYRSRARILSNNARETDALADISTVLMLDPRDTLALKQRYWIYSSPFRDYEKAMADAEKYISVDSGSYWPFYAKGEIFEQQREFRNAADAFSEAIQRDSSSAYNFMRRGTCFFELGEPDSALSDYESCDRLWKSRYPTGARWMTNLVMGRGESAAAMARVRIETGAPDSATFGISAVRTYLGYRLAGLAIPARDILETGLLWSDSSRAEYHVLRYAAHRTSESELLSMMPLVKDSYFVPSFLAIDRLWSGDRAASDTYFRIAESSYDTTSYFFLAAREIRKRNIMPRKPGARNIVHRFIFPPSPDSQSAQEDTMAIKRGLEEWMSRADSGTTDSFALLLSWYLDQEENDSFLAHDRSSHARVSSKDSERVEQMRGFVAFRLVVKSRPSDAEELLSRCPLYRQGSESSAYSPVLNAVSALMFHYSFNGSHAQIEKLEAEWGERLTGYDRTFLTIFGTLRKFPAVFVSLAMLVASLVGGSILATLFVFRRRGATLGWKTALIFTIALLTLQVAATFGAGVEDTRMLRWYLMAASLRDFVMVLASITLLRLAGAGSLRRRNVPGIAAAILICIAWTAMLAYAWPPAESALILELKKTALQGEMAILFAPQTNIGLAMLLVILPAIREELICRGLFLPLLFLQTGGSHADRAISRPWIISSIAVACLWAIAHAGMVEPEWWKFAQVLGLGIVLSEVARRGGLAAAILVHALFNVIAVISSLYIRS